MPSKTEARTNDGGTPLILAAHQGHLEVVRFLVESVPTRTKARQMMEQRLYT